MRTEKQTFKEEQGSPFPHFVQIGYKSSFKAVLTTGPISRVDKTLMKCTQKYQ